jgi:rubrerythrin
MINMMLKTELGGGIGMQILSETKYDGLSGKPQFEKELLLIREDLAEEWGAAIGYLGCSLAIKDRLLSEQFHEAAQDEAGHIIRLTRMLAALDQSQGEALNKEGLFWLAGFEHQAAISPVSPKEVLNTESRECYRQGKQGWKRYLEPDDLALELLRNAVRDELLAINAYQRQVGATTNLTVKNVLNAIIKRKKEHVAAFTASLAKLLREYRLSMG